MLVFSTSNCPQEADLKTFSRFDDKLRYWNKQTVVEHYHSLLHNKYQIILWLHKNINGCQVPIIFKLTEQSRSCSKRNMNIFQLSQLMMKLISINDEATNEEFLDFFWKNIHINMFKRSLVFGEKKKKTKLYLHCIKKRDFRLTKFMKRTER